MAAPLEHLKIVDMSTVLMGPYATQLLGDMGADIIKVEPPEGDTVRGIGPARHEGMGGIFLQVNRGKRSIVLDLKQDEGRAALLKLIEDADLFVYNMRPQVMERLRLSYEDVAAANPRVVYAGLFGYGQDGPYAARPAYDDLIQGITSLPNLYVAAGGTSRATCRLRWRTASLGSTPSADARGGDAQSSHGPRSAPRCADVRDDGGLRPRRPHGRPGI